MNTPQCYVIRTFPRFLFFSFVSAGCCVDVSEKISASVIMVDHADVAVLVPQLATSVALQKADSLPRFTETSTSSAPASSYSHIKSNAMYM